MLSGMKENVKGNSKWKLRGYRTRKYLIMAGALFATLLVFSVLFIGRSSSPQAQKLRKGSQNLITKSKSVLNKFKHKKNNDANNKEETTDGQVEEENEETGTDDDTSKDKEDKDDGGGGDDDDQGGEKEEGDETGGKKNDVDDDDDDYNVNNEEEPPKFNLYDAPTLKYGTADKGDDTASLVAKAIRAGFRHIDTDLLPKNYDEKAVGEGWKTAVEELGLERSDIFLQTKFTNVAHQDPDSVPYEEDTELEDQVRASIEQSLENLQTDYIDSYILHNPEADWAKTFKVYGVMEEYFNNGKIKQLGVSNCWNADFIKYFYSKVNVKPKVVQQKINLGNQYMFGLRKFCHVKEIELQIYGALSANEHVFDHEDVITIAAQKGMTPQAAILAFYLSVGISPLVGTTSEEHMAQDIDVYHRIITNKEDVFVTSDENEDEDEIKMIAKAFPIDLDFHLT